MPATERGDDVLLDDAATETERLTNVTLVEDDLFDSRLPAGAYDLVHARFQLAPLGRAAEQLRAYRRLARPGTRGVTSTLVRTWATVP